jgi:glycosyltransferase involved in cell wall biosynthesis
VIYSKIGKFMKKVCITTLTSRDRLGLLKVTVDSFVARTTLLPNETLDWYILSNGSSERVNAYLKELEEQPHPGINFIVEYSEVNLGVGVGLMRLYNKAKDNYEYVYCLEDDWLVLPYELSGKDSNWLVASIEMLDNNPHISQVLLRRYSSEMEMRQFDLQSITQSLNTIGEFKVLSVTDVNSLAHKEYVFGKMHSTYTNNPHIRRDKTFWDMGVLPLPYYENETKENSNWGQAEIAADQQVRSKNLETWTMINPPVQHTEHVEGRTVEQNGINMIRRDDRFTGCGLYNEREDQVGGCKYGFTEHLKRYCATCDKNTNITGLNAHEHRFIDILRYTHGMYNEKNVTQEEGWEKVEELMGKVAVPAFTNWKELLEEGVR